MTDATQDAERWRALVDLDRPHFDRLHKLQHGAPPLAKPRLGSSIIGWACDEIDALRQRAEEAERKIKVYEQVVQENIRLVDKTLHDMRQIQRQMDAARAIERQSLVRWLESPTGAIAKVEEKMRWRTIESGREWVAKALKIVAQSASTGFHEIVEDDPA